MGKVGSNVYVFGILIACIVGGYLFVSDTIKKDKAKSRGVKIIGGGTGLILLCFLFMLIIFIIKVRKGMRKGLNKLGDMGRTRR